MFAVDAATLSPADCGMARSAAPRLGDTYNGLEPPPSGELARATTPAGVRTNIQAGQLNPHLATLAQTIGRQLARDAVAAALEQGRCSRNGAGSR